MPRLTMIQAQDRYIARVNNPDTHPGHQKRVQRSAANQLYQWATKRGYNADVAVIIVDEARQVAKLIRNSED